MVNQGNFLYLMSLSILTICLLDNVWITYGEVTFYSLLGVKGLKAQKVQSETKHLHEGLKILK